MVGWDDHSHAINEQRTFTDGRIVFVGGKARRARQKRADYLLRYRSGFPIAVVEAKARYRRAAEGLQQAKDSETLGLRFAYATSGDGIVEFDYSTGIERVIADFLAPENLWTRLRHADGLEDDRAAERLLTSTFPDRASQAAALLPEDRRHAGGLHDTVARPRFWRTDPVVRQRRRTCLCQDCEGTTLHRTAYFPGRLPDRIALCRRMAVATRNVRKF